tara:strand:- start:214 stop:429 length:216 start_codon:yes stop_codon:yes gene_type:complete
MTSRQARKCGEGAFTETTKWERMSAKQKRPLKHGISRECQPNNGKLLLWLGLVVIFLCGECFEVKRKSKAI